MRVLNTVWFTTGMNETIGIVMVEDEHTGERKAYIGLGDGHNEEMDIGIIKDYGAKIYPSSLLTVQDHFLGR